VQTSNPAPTTTTLAPSAIQTGSHWAEPSDYPTLKNIGYSFAITNVAPGDLAGAAAKLDAAKAAGIKLIIGLYAFGGPEPYSYANGQWTITQAAQNSLNYFKSRETEILAFFGLNEPYYTGLTGTNACGYYSAAQLRQFRTQIRAIWPGAKIYHDIGQPSEWAPGGSLYNSYSCIGQKYADQTGVADYVGVWDYPFELGGYMKTRALATLSRETSFVINSMGAIPVWLNQSHAASSLNLLFPTTASLLDWNCSVRRALPAGSLISWYVWRQGIYSDVLASHPEDWSSTNAAACA
jgi:hypothetical protein